MGELLRAGDDGPHRVTATDYVRSTLRSAILRGELPGDSRLVQTEIAGHLGVSTTPVREAMRDLAAEGLITMDTHRVGTVRTPDWDEMLEIVEMRRVLEPLGVARAMEHITRGELEQARVLADHLASEEDPGSWIQANIRFHSVFHRATRTSRLSSTLVSLQEASGIFVAQAHRLDPEIRRRAIEDHYALLETYELEDEVTAVEIGDRHLRLPLEASPRSTG